MHHPTDPSQRITRRLLPLYAAAFLQSCVFWYSVEKLFMTSIGFTATTIGVMVAAYSAIMLLIETPSGLLADRWSRKGILIIASVMLAIAGLVCGLAATVIMFIVGSLFWGVFYALYSGTYDPIVYDTLLEETGHTNDFKKYYGRVKFLDAAGLVVGALAGGAIGAFYGLSASFLWSIPVALISIMVLFVFREPKLHMAEVAAPIMSHIKHTFSAVINHSSLVGMLIILVLGTVLVELIYEFAQLWLIAIETPVAMFGLASGILLSTVGLAGLLAPKLRLENRRFVVFFTAILIISGVVLITVPLTWPIVAAQTIVTVGLLAAGIVYLERLHDRLPSAVRSGASSAVSTIGRVLFIGMAVAFGWASQHFSVFQAGWLILVPLILISVFLYLETGKKLS